MSHYQRKIYYGRDLAGGNGRQMLFPWSAKFTISTEETAQILGVSRDTVRNMIEAGELEAYPVRPGIKNTPWRVVKESVILFCERKLAKYSTSDEELCRRIDVKMRDSTAGEVCSKPASKKG